VRVTAVTAALLVTWLAPAPAAQAPAPLGRAEAPLRVEPPASYRVCADCPSQEFPFRVTVLDRAMPVTFTAAPRIVDVSPAVGTADGRQASFGARWSAAPPADRQVQTLIVSLTGELRSPGTYEVVVDFNLTERPAAPRQVLKFTVPPARLAAPEKLLIARTLWWPIATSERQMPLDLFETTGDLSVREVSLRSLPFSADNRPIAGALAPANTGADGRPKPVGVAAGGSEHLPYRLDGHFPLGLATGKIRLEATELAEAIVIPVEVRSQLSWVHLLAAVALGLVLSYHVKIRLERNVQLQQARVAAATLLAQVEPERKEFEKDAEFTQKTSPDALNAALEPKPPAKPDAEKINKARTELDAAWRAARQDLAARRASFRTRLDGWRKLIDLTWDMPQTMTSVVARARGEVPGIASHDTAGDVGGATTALDTAQARTIMDLQRAAYAWQAASRRFFDSLVDKRGGGISDANLDPLARASTAWRQLSPRIASPPTGVASETEATLRGITGEYVTARDHLRDMPRHLRREFDDVAALLLSEEAPEPLVTAIDDALAALEGTLAQAVDDPAAAAAALPAVRATLQAAWAAAFAQAATNDRPAVIAHVKANNYRAAAALLGRKPLRAPGASGPAAPGGRPGLPFHTAPHAPSGSVATAGAPRVDPPRVLQLDAEKALKTAKRHQTYIVGGLFGLWVLTTSAAGYDGTVRGVFVALFSAFGLDLGIDALRAKLTGKLFG
jgi:hypothetical protein